MRYPVQFRRENIHLLFAAIVLILTSHGATAQQWTGPDANGNISNANSGKVGVANSNPANLLDVGSASIGTLTGNAIGVSNTAGNSSVAVGQSSTARGRIKWNFNATEANSYFSLGDSTGAHPLVLQDLGGNVGIGTISPGARLEIKDGNYADQLRIGHGDGFLYKIGRDTNGLLTFQGTQSAYTGYLFKGITNEIFRTPRLDRNGYDNGSSAPELVLGRGDGSGTLSGGLLRAPDASGTNIAGGNLTFSSGLATGNAASGDIIFQGAPVGSTGSTLQTAVNYFTIKGGGSTAGNVGIGTTTPGYKLDVQGGQVNASGGLCIAGDCKSAWSQVGGSSQWANNGSSINFSTGNVGIGTSNPQQKLAVEGSVAVRPSKAHYFTPTAPLHVFGNSISSRTDSSVQEILVLSQSNDATGGGYFNKGSHFSIGLSFWEDPGNNLPRTRVDFRTTGRNTDSETASNTVMSLRDDGNVGIGTTSPSAKLDVVGNIRLSNSYLDLQGAAGATGLVRSHPTVAGVEVGSLSNHPLWFITNSAERMRIDGNGTVGIGTSTPNAAYKLDVQGGTINSSGGFCMAGDCKTSWSQVGGGTSSAANVSSGQFGANTGGGSYAFPSAVNVNGGSSSNWAGLNVGGTASINAAGNIYSYSRICAGNNSGTCDSAGGVVLAGTGSNAYGSIYLTGSGNTYFNGGNVGIGTTTPSASLMVTRGSGSSGTAVFVGTTYASHFNYSTTEDTYIRGGKAGSAVYINDAQNGNVGIAAGGGNVGIGTNTPGAPYKLDVVGDIRVSGNINAKYQDVAEWVPSSEILAAGTVVVLDPTKSNQVTSSSTAYDTRVAGVISAQPGITLGEKSEEKVLVATTGRVRVMVDATKTPINIGDLLVTSDVPGVAMKSIPVEFAGRQMHMPGTIIGKALEPLAKGKGEIMVLLSLQ